MQAALMSLVLIRLTRRRREKKTLLHCFCFSPMFSSSSDVFLIWNLRSSSRGQSTGTMDRTGRWPAASPSIPLARTLCLSPLWSTIIILMLRRRRRRMCFNYCLSSINLPACTTSVSRIPQWCPSYPETTGCYFSPSSNIRRHLPPPPCISGFNREVGVLNSSSWALTGRAKSTLSQFVGVAAPFTLSLHRFHLMPFRHQSA